MKYMYIGLRVVAAILLLQTLFFKFSGAKESIYIFTKVGMEPWGRYGSGITELIAGILLLSPRHYHIGSLISLAVVGGAIFFHLTILGIDVQGDGGYLFILALVVFISSLILAVHKREDLLLFLRLKKS